MKQPVEIVMLSTEDKSSIYHTDLADRFKFQLYVKNDKLKTDFVRMGYKPQHLYITVSQDIESIKKGDWVYNQKSKKVYQINIVNEIVDYENKIIATTNFKLLVDFKGHEKYTGREYEAKVYLPKVPQSFLEEFVANPNGKWEIEYEVEECGYDDGQILYDYDNSKLKLNQDNTTNITLVEEKMYSKSIVIKAYEDGYYNATAGGNGNTQSQEDWIKENL